MQVLFNFIHLLLFAEPLVAFVCFFGFLFLCVFFFLPTQPPWVAQPTIKLLFPQSGADNTVLRWCNVAIAPWL